MVSLNVLNTFMLKVCELAPRSKPVFRSWVPKIVKRNWHPIFKWRPQHTKITTINVYSLNELKHNIPTQCHDNYIAQEERIYMLEIAILRNSSQKISN